MKRKKVHTFNRGGHWGSFWKAHGVTHAGIGGKGSTLMWEKNSKCNNKFQHLVFAPFNEDGHNENWIATKQPQVAPTSIMTPPIATQGSPKAVVKANMEWSSTKLSGAKRILEANFSNESSLK